MATRATLQRLASNNGMEESLPTTNFNAKRFRRRLVNVNGVPESPEEGSNRQQSVETDRMTEPHTICFLDTRNPHMDGTALIIEPHGCSSDQMFEGLENHCLHHKTAVCPSDADDSCGSTNNGRRVYALRPRKASKLRQEIYLESVPRGKKPNIPVGGSYSSSLVAKFEDIADGHQRLETLTHPDESGEETQNAEGSESQQYHRRASAKFAGRVTASPLRNLATIFRSKLLHGDYCNLLKLATEIHVEAKEKHNTAMRRIYDVVNVAEAAGCLERSIVSRSGIRMKQCSKGSPLSGSLIRWCENPTLSTGYAKYEETLRSLKIRLSKKEEELRNLEEEMELLETLMRYRKMKAAFAEYFPPSTLFHDNETATDSVEGFSDQPHGSPTPNGITVPFCLLKVNRGSDDRNFEVSTYADGSGQGFQVVFSSDHLIQPYGWGWFVREMSKISK